MDKDEIKKGTTTVGLLSKDGVVLASETRATMGNLIANKEVEKIFRIQDHIGITTAGGVADAQKLVRTMQVETNLYQIERNHPMKVDAAVTLLANILHNQRWFPFWVQLLIGGYDEKPKLFSLDALGSVIEEKVVATGSGSPMAYGVLEDNYKEGATVEENVKLAVRAIRAAISRDAFSGNGINVVTITKDGYKKVDTAKYLK